MEYLRVIVMIYLVNIAWFPYIFIYYIETYIETDKKIELTNQTKNRLDKNHTCMT